MPTAKKPVFLTKQRMYFIARRIILPALAIQISLGAVAGVRSLTVKSNDYGAILVSGNAYSRYDYWVYPAVLFGAYPYWTYYFNNRGLKARWFARAKASDLEKVIRDKACKSIVLVGHGSFNAWQATDIDVTNKEVEEMMLGLPKKDGEWLQLTCGVSDAFPIKMGELVMQKERVYTYNGPVNTFIFITDALFGFKYLKSLNKAQR